MIRTFKLFGLQVNEVKYLRHCIRILLLESLDDPDLTGYVDTLESSIIEFLMSDSTIDILSSQPIETEQSVKLGLNRLFDDYPNINEVHLALSVNDNFSASVDAAYVCDVRDRSKSNLIIAIDVPRGYPRMKEFQGWLSAELADTLSHELQHSCDTTEILDSEECIDGPEKWESVENIGRYYGCEAEVRGHVAGILGRARRTNEDPMDLLDTDMETIESKALSKGFSSVELRPILDDIYNKWLTRLETSL